MLAISGPCRQERRGADIAMTMTWIEVYVVYVFDDFGM